MTMGMHERNWELLIIMGVEMSALATLHVWQVLSTMLK